MRMPSGATLAPATAPDSREGQWLGSVDLSCLDAIDDLLRDLDRPSDLERIRWLAGVALEVLGLRVFLGLELRCAERPHYIICPVRPDCCVLLCHLILLLFALPRCDRSMRYTVRAVKGRVGRLGRY